MAEIANPDVDAIISAATATTIEPDVRKPVQGGISPVIWMANAGMLVAPWWSKRRDNDLRKWVKGSDHVSGAVYNMQAKMRAIPFRIIAVDQAIKEHVDQAERETKVLREAAELGTGWGTFFGKWVEELLTQDNGTFAELIGEGDTEGPLMGRPITVRHLDTYRCLGRDSRVRMADGTKKSILKLVREKDDSSVLSIGRSGHVEVKKITGWHENKLGDGRYWIHIGLKTAKRNFGRKEKLWVTNDHEILSDSGWKRADTLEIGDRICTQYPSPSKEQMQLITGMLLGDGSVSRQFSFTSWCKLAMTHGEKQEKWLKLKIYALRDLSFGPIRQSKKSSVFQVETHNNPAFVSVRNNWYKTGKKSIPRSVVAKNFSNLMLAVWYLDDGNMIKSASENSKPRGRLYTNSFSREDVDWLANLLSKHGVTSKTRSLVNTTGRTEYFIYITTDGFEKLVEMISPYVPLSMRYKLPDSAEPFDESLWDLSPAEQFYDYIELLKRGNNGEQTNTFCIDVEDNHNFIAGGMVVHNCQRTGNSIYPVIYHNTDGRQYKLHYTRVLFDAQMSSPIAEMFGVGFCAVSRCINISQTLTDTITYKQEKLGSRPHRAIIVPHGGLDPTDIAEAFQLAEGGMDAQGLTRYSKVVVAGSSTLQDAGLNVYELSSLPDGFDEETSTVLGMATIALAFGMDARELFPAMQAGATRADALLQHMKQRGKGPGEILEMTERLFDQKYLPAHLKLIFDFQDDAADKMSAEVKKVRSDGRVQDLDSGAINVRIAREHMMETGDLTKSQFARLELMDGRLEDGTIVLALFFSKDKRIKKYLDLGVSDPMDVEANDEEAMGVLIREKTTEVEKAIVNAKNEKERDVAFQALMALVYLEKHYQDPQSSIDVMLGRADKEPEGEMPDGRVRDKNPADASVDESDAAKRSTNIDHPDDRPE